MPTGAPLPVREYASAAENRRHAREVHARIWGATPPRKPTPPVEARPEAVVAELSTRELIEPGHAKPVPVEEIVAVAPTSLPATAAQRAGRAALRGTDCLRIVAQVADVRQADLKGPSRVAYLVRARQIAAWLLVHRAGKSLPEAGRMLGGRDHTTILHACRRIDAVGLPAPVMTGDAVALVVALWAETRPPAYRGAAP